MKTLDTDYLGNVSGIDDFDSLYSLQRYLYKVESGKIETNIYELVGHLNSDGFKIGLY